MLRPFLALCLCCTLPLAQAASLKEYRLADTVRQVAQQSSQGTPRPINEFITDQGYTAEGTTLINHLSVTAAHAAQMRENPLQVRNQLGNSVCSNPGFAKLLGQGVQLVYRFTEQGSKKTIATEHFTHKDCS